MDNEKKIIVSVIVVLLVALGFTVVVANLDYNHFNTQMYPIQKAESYLNLANTSTNLTQISAYLNDTNAEIKNYTGNPDWWFPTYVTQWSDIRQDISTVQHQIAQFNKTTNLTGIPYLQDVGQIHQSTSSIKNLLSVNYHWVGEQPFYLVINVMFFFTTLFTLIYALVLFEDDKTITGWMYMASFIAMLVMGIIISIL